MKNTITMNDGLKIPQLGYGTYLVENNAVYNLVIAALETGYDHIDTATFYGNESGIGRALQDSGANREDIFLTTKVWIDDFSYDATAASVKGSLEKLRTGYLDLVLIHWPKPGYLECWDALVDLKRDGLIRSVGVSNFNQRFLEELRTHSDVIPAANQIECHPLFPQDDVVEYCRENGIVVESWAPLAQGQLLDDPVLERIGEQYGKSRVQIMLRWHLQRGLVAIPKTAKTGRLAENLSVFDFELSSADMDAIKGMDTNTMLGFDPEIVYDHGFVRKV